MATGLFLYHLDKTTCGGRILGGAEDDTYEVGGIERQQVRAGDPVTCGKHEGWFRVCGGMGDTYEVGGVAKEWAGSLDSYSSCPCRSRFIPSVLTHTYESTCNAGRVAEREETARRKKLAEAKEKGLEPMPIPALIYQTKNRMDDYQAKDMHHGDLDILTLRNRFRIDVDNVSTKVNPYTLTAKEPLNPYPFLSPYERAMLPDEPVRRVSKEESAGLMFDEFRELAKLFSFHGPYKNIITEMITHMQENRGTPYSNPLLDSALKAQILNDRSEQSSLLVIKKALKTAVNYEYGFIPLSKENIFYREISEAILPKFNRAIDNTNGLVITVHDIWATHITLVSLQVSGNSYRATVHYRIQDHFGLDDDDVLNPLYREFRIFRLWFTLQRWDEYGYRPFITEMNTTVEISGRLGE
ncbi:PAAR domain-containing protein [Rosenbergiella nectarea]|uniref:PAAR domain-containing protein n=1 Tax=Rosenbergiella nectarea TaxID=988801 RepID=UPI001F4D4BE9|nr:PAAR domain-containing protein [Rosenbergiella nectarea]